jgi:transaldolase
MKNKLIENIEIYADGADINFIKDINFNFSGYTTNPTLMKNSGIKDYKKFVIDFLEISENKPVSFEVFADDINEIKSQAKIISSWSPNIYVKIPITNTLGESTTDLVFDLIEDGVKCNVTAIFTLDQIKKYKNLTNKTNCILSVFAGRIADTGVDPIPIITEIVDYFKDNKNIKILWASPRELLNIFHAIQSKCHIITIAKDIINKINSIDKNLDEFSLETVKMFYNDAMKVNYQFKNQ